MNELFACTEHASEASLQPDLADVLIFVSFSLSVSVSPPLSLSRSYPVAQAWGSGGSD